MIRIQFDAEALDDLAQAMAYHDEEAPDLGRELLAAVTDALDQLAFFPASAPLVCRGRSSEARGQLSLPPPVCIARRGATHRGGRARAPASGFLAAPRVVTHAHGAPPDESVRKPGIPVAVYLLERQGILARARRRWRRPGCRRDHREPQGGAAGPQPAQVLVSLDRDQTRAANVRAHLT